MADSKTKGVVAMQPLPQELRDLDTLLNHVENASDSPLDISLQQLCSFLQKSESAQEINYELMTRAFKYLQTCSLSSTLEKLLEIGIVQILARTYDNLIHRDYSRREVLSSILELLYLVEDLSESAEGKAQCGKCFVYRILALATTKVLSVNLHRAAVETLCALITRSPANQQRVLDNIASCQKMFRQCLPSCGDFLLQASITEVLYRLSKQGPQLLDFISEKSVRAAMRSLLQRQKPDLLAEIKAIVILLNNSLGPKRSVYSFLASEITLNAKSVTSSEDKWINFGKGHFSLYHSESLNPGSNLDGPTILDVQYEDILDFRISSCNIFEMLIQDNTTAFSLQSSNVNPKHPIKARIQIAMAPPDISVLKEHILPKLRTRSTQPKQELMQDSSVVGYFRKSSMGILVPLPRGRKSALQLINAARTCSPSPNVTLLQEKSKMPNMNSHVADGTRNPEKDLSSKPANCRGTTTANFSEEPIIVKATPQQNLLGQEQMQKHDEIQNRSNACGSKPEDRKMTSEKSTKTPCQAPKALGPVSRIFKRLNGIVSSQQRRNPAADLTDVDNNQSSVQGCINHLDATVQRITRDSNVKPIVEEPDPLVGRNHRTDSQESPSPFNIVTGPRLGGFEHKPEIRPPGSECHTDGDISRQLVGAVIGLDMSPKSKVSKIPSHEVRREGEDHLMGNQSAPSSLKGGSLRFKEGLGVEAVKQTTEKLDWKAVDTIRHDTLGSPPSGRIVPKPTTQKSGPVKTNKLIAPRKCKTVDPAYEDSKSRSDSEELSPDDSEEEEWVPGKLYTAAPDSIKADSDNEDRRPGAEKTIRQRKGRQGPCSNAGKTRKTPARVQRAKSATKFKARTERAPKENSAVPKKTAQKDVYSFASEDDERKLGKTDIASTLKRKLVDKNDGRKRKVTTPSVTPIHVCRGRGRPRKNPQILQDITNVQSPTSERPTPKGLRFPRLVSSGETFYYSAGQSNQKEIQKDELEQEQEATEDSVLATKRRSTRQQANKPSDTDIRDKRSRIERWKSSTLTKLKIPNNISDGELSGESPVISPAEISPTAERDVPDSPSAATDDKSLHLITTLLRNFKDKIQTEKKRKLENIVTHTSQLIQLDVESTQSRIQSDVADFVQLSKEKYGKLHHKLEGQCKKMRLTYEQFKKDFAEHIQQYENIVSEIDETDLELIDIARQKGQGHKELFSQLQDSSTRYLAEAEQNIFSVTKASRSMYGLKTALKGIVHLEC